ncbi:PQQ-dependent sugar dehydrogenase [Ectobacillus ponti]|uniref:PQQ-dependent sugar dehydrogenase n=1 Tax=Ectobacillus ponti TaxID=2961894 RepID=A0AA41XA98_9BACI|nr:PQQ-dependent sugar dehydrogenase [Ectobacillus ponti]MCP8969158.1 PQQ-dependent sugar dehydrogenase [Ectobacillus ponti]
MRYIPEGMLEKQYRWELVHNQLYYHLYHFNTETALQPLLLRLLQTQEAQLQELRCIGDTSRIAEPEPAFPATVWETASMLYEREYELLQEYLSYQVYFLKSSAGSPPLQALLHSQYEQVNTLLAVVQAYEETEAKHTLQKASPYNVWMEPGYRLEQVAAALTYPTALAFDDQDRMYVLEAGYAYDEPKRGRILRYDRQGMSVFADDLAAPATGLAWHEGYVYVAESNLRGEENRGGSIVRIAPDGTKTRILSGLATYGDHFTGDVLFGPDGRLYFSVGAATNAGVVGPDNEGWLQFHPGFCDMAARPTELSLQNFVSRDAAGRVKVTGAFQPYGQSNMKDGTALHPSFAATGVLYSCNPDGTDVRMVADGFRNPYGLGFSPFNGKLYATDNGCDPRGSRPIHKDWDHFWEIQPGGWYGWPDLLSGLPCTLPHFQQYGKPKPLHLLKRHPRLAGQPQARFAPSSSSNKFDFSTNAAFGHQGEIFVAQTGALAYTPGKEAPSGFRVVRMNAETGQISSFLWNEGAEENPNGPIRPVQAKFDRRGEALYVVDLGIIGNYGIHTMPQPGSGAVWRITKQ